MCTTSWCSYAPDKTDVPITIKEVVHNLYTGIACYDGDVRLVDGRQPNEGRVEVCFNQTWGTICQWISPFSWNHSQADIVCNQLGYSQAGEILPLNSAKCH